MCEHGTNTLVRVRIPADLSCSGRAKWKRMRIDACIAPLVRALQEGGVNMRGSCCGHGEGPGSIDLEDGRTVVILSKDQARRQVFIDQFHGKQPTNTKGHRP
jgi:hypothetical protein